MPSGAAAVGVGGKVLSSDGRSLPGAQLTLLNADSPDEPQRALSNAFGRYRFEQVTAGTTYLPSVRRKRFQFAPQLVQVFDELENFDLTAQN